MCSDPKGMSPHNAAEPWKCTCTDCLYNPTFWSSVSDAYVTMVSVSTGLYCITGAVNNGINFVYYTYFSDGKCFLDWDSQESTYVDTYITRWDRLDYAKQETGDSVYGLNAWRFYSEYSLHMYGWYAVKPFLDKGFYWLEPYGSSLEQVHILPHAPDEEPKTRMLTYLFGFLGL